MSLIASYRLWPTPQHRQPLATEPVSRSTHPATTRRKMRQKTLRHTRSIKDCCDFYKKNFGATVAYVPMNPNSLARFWCLHIGLPSVWHTACTWGGPSGYEAPAQQPFPTLRWGL